MKHELVLVLDFGGQYNQLIARRVREAGVYCEMLPYNTTIEEIKAKKPIGIIFTGGPATVTADDAPICNKEVFELGIPVLGICYGMQLISVLKGGNVKKASQREYGRVEINLKESLLFNDCEKDTICWMSHTYHVDKIPDGFEITARSKNCPVGAMQSFRGLEDVNIC